MFDISILFIYVDSDFPPNFLSLLFTLPLLYSPGRLGGVSMPIVVTMIPGCKPYSSAPLYRQVDKFKFLWYDNFGENQTPLQRNGLTAIPKIDPI